MRPVVCAALISLTLLLGHGVAEPRYSVLGEGSLSCGQWIAQRRAAGPNVIPAAAWVLGYITAANMLRQSGPNFAAGVNGITLDYWMDNYCATNSLETVADAANALVNELRQRKSRISN